MNIGGIILLVGICAFLVVEVIGLATTIVKKRKEQKQKKQESAVITNNKGVTDENDNRN